MNDNHLYIKVGIFLTQPFLLFDKLFKVIGTLAHVTCCNLNPLGFQKPSGVFSWHCLFQIIIYFKTYAAEKRI